MSFIIRIAGADFSGSGLPALKRTVRGFDADGLVGLYLPNETTIGAGVSSITDLSEQGNAATLMSDFPAPLQTASGLQSQAGRTNSFIFDTGIPMTPDMTVFYCGRSLTPAASTEAWEIFLSDTAADIPTDRADSANNATRPNIAGRLDRDGEVLGESVAFMDRSGLYAPSYLFANPSDTYGKCTAPCAAGLRIGENGEFTAKKSGGWTGNAEATTPSASAVSTLYSTAGNVCFGHWTTGSTANTQHQAAFYGAVVYDRLLTPAEMDTVIANLLTQVSARGVTF